MFAYWDDFFKGNRFGGPLFNKFLDAPLINEVTYLHMYCLIYTMFGYLICIRMNKSK